MNMTEAAREARRKYQREWNARNADKRREFQQDRENTRRYDVEDHEAYPDAPIMEEISRSLPMTRRDRPQWDVDALLALGFSHAAAELDAGEKLWNEEERINYASTPGFMIRAIK